MRLCGHPECFYGGICSRATCSGKLFDKVGTRTGYVLAISLWGVSSITHSFARGILSISFFRVTLGLGEAGNWPGAVKSNAVWFPIKERTVAEGIVGGNNFPFFLEPI